MGWKLCEPGATGLGMCASIGKFHGVLLVLRKYNIFNRETQCPDFSNTASVIRDWLSIEAVPRPDLDKSLGQKNSPLNSGGRFGETIGTDVAEPRMIWFWCVDTVTSLGTKRMWIFGYAEIGYRNPAEKAH